MIQPRDLVCVRQIPLMLIEALTVEPSLQLPAESVLGITQYLQRGERGLFGHAPLALILPWSIESTTMS